MKRKVQLSQVSAGQPPDEMREIVLAVLEVLAERASYPTLEVRKVGGRFIFPDLEKLPDTVRRVFGKRAKDGC